MIEVDEAQASVFKVSDCDPKVEGGRESLGKYVFLLETRIEKSQKK